jgi:hypothetical protein
MRRSRAARARVHAFGGLALIAIVGAGLGTSCDGPQGPAAQSPTGFDARWEGGTLAFTLDGAPGGRLALVATGLEFDAATEVLRAEVAVQNNGERATVGPHSILVSGFVPADVVPLDVLCGDPLPAGECAFDHRGSYGDDGILSPGETSAPVVWRLHVPGGHSFAFRARLAEPQPLAGTIAGVVFADADADGARDPGEIAVADARVLLRFGARTDERRTDARGRYAFHVAAPGLYEIDLEPRRGWRPTTAVPFQVVVLRLGDGSLSSFDQGDIGLALAGPGPTVTIEGFAYADADRDGIRDAGEPGLAGVKIEGRACERIGATLADDDDDFEARTDAFGHYALVLPDCGGPWEIRGGSVDHYDRTTPRTIVLLGPDLHADFGYAPEDASTHFEVSGVVFRDDDGDGAQDPFEPPLAGVLVTADGIACAGPAFASDRTDEQGRYELDGDDVACPLPWRVQREALHGTIDTTPASVLVDAPPVLGRDIRVDFGVRFAPNRARAAVARQAPRGD